MGRMTESRLTGLRQRRLLCLRELEIHLARGGSEGPGVQTCLAQIERINAEMLKVAASTVSASSVAMGADQRAEGDSGL